MLQSSEINYIRQLTGAMEKIALDEALNPSHVSLYLALFMYWNLNRFENPVSISRGEIMKLSKIGSNVTYLRCLKELHELGYIIYNPSHNPFKGSQVSLFNFCTSDEQALIHYSSINEQALIHNSSKNEQALNPSINSINNKQYKHKLIEVGKSKFTPPSLEEVSVFFSETKASNSEAENFYNYFESNGWLVGGKAKMKNWKAAARNWIKRAPSFSGNSKTYLHADPNTDYTIPL